MILTANTNTSHIWCVFHEISSCRDIPQSFRGIVLIEEDTTTQRYSIPKWLSFTRNFLTWPQKEQGSCSVPNHPPSHSHCPSHARFDACQRLGKKNQQQLLFVLDMTISATNSAQGSQRPPRSSSKCPSLETLCLKLSEGGTARTLP